MAGKSKLKDAWGIFEKTKVLHFITYDGKHFFCRPMSGVLIGGNTIYAATFIKSKKVAQTKYFGKGAFYVYDPKSHHYACISGKAEVGQEREWRKKLWHDDWKVYYKDGIDDKNYVYIKLKVENIDYVTDV